MLEESVDLMSLQTLALLISHGISVDSTSIAHNVSVQILAGTLGYVET